MSAETCIEDGCDNETVVDWNRCWSCYVELIDNIEFEPLRDEEDTAERIVEIINALGESDE